MKALICEMCGSKDIVKKGGLFICQFCGVNVTTHNSCQNGHIHQNTPGKPELSKVLPR